MDAGATWCMNTIERSLLGGGDAGCRYRYCIATYFLRLLI